MIQFINREEELEFLSDHYKRSEAGFIVIYGRRRIGKTELISKFIKDKKSLYFLGRRESESETFSRLSKEFFRVFHDELLITRPFNSWDSVFDYLYEKTKEEKMAVAIDEFPFILERFQGLASTLQDHWDNKLQFTNILLILSGSSIGVMETEVLGYKSPLYGRRTGQWMVKPLNFFELKEFLPKYPVEELIKVYGCLDSIPGYLAKFDPSKGLEENIKLRIFKKGEFLYLEPEFLLREELRDPSNYMSILKAVAAGNSKFGEICASTQLDKSLVSKYLSVLENLHIVERVFTVFTTGKARLKGRGMYRVKDKFFTFWFRYVYPFQDYLEMGETETVVEFWRKDFDIYLGYVFEDVSKEFLWELNKTGRFLFPVLRMGRWWHDEEEIDLVALNGDTKDISFFEVKWGQLSKKAAERILAELKHKAEHVQWHNRSRRERFGIIAKKIEDKRGLREEGYLAYDLSDMGALLPQALPSP